MHSEFMLKNFKTEACRVDMGYPPAVPAKQTFLAGAQYEAARVPRFDDVRRRAGQGNQGS